MAYTTINKPSQYFNVNLWTGNQTLTNINVGFQPSFVWIKSRSDIQVHALFDQVRGVSIGALQSNATAAENANQKLVAYTSNGFTLPSTNYEWTNTTGWTYVGWSWIGNGAGVSNTQGSITSTVSVNQTAGVSIVGYTGTGANATVGHGLGVAPDMIICKSRTQAQNWAVYHSSLGNTKAVFLDGTGAATTSSSYWNNTSPTSTVFTVGNSGDVNYNAGTQISYCFSSIKGFSKFGSYTGNGSTDGTFIYTGFKPAYVGFKKSSAAGTNWVTSNNKVNTFNAVTAYLHQNTDANESTGSRDIDFLSNGFKIRNSNSTWNESGATFIYMAFAENPFVSSTFIPTTAR